MALPFIPNRITGNRLSRAASDDNVPNGVGKTGQLDQSVRGFVAILDERISQSSGIGCVTRTVASVAGRAEWFDDR